MSIEQSIEQIVRDLLELAIREGLVLPNPAYRPNPQDYSSGELTTTANLLSSFWRHGRGKRAEYERTSELSLAGRTAAGEMTECDKWRQRAESAERAIARWERERMEPLRQRIAQLESMNARWLDLVTRQAKMQPPAPIILQLTEAEIVRIRELTGGVALCMRCREESGIW